MYEIAIKIDPNDHVSYYNKGNSNVYLPRKYSSKFRITIRGN